MVNGTKSFKVNRELWKKVKVHVAKSETNIISFIEDVIKEKLSKKRRCPEFKNLEPKIIYSREY